MSRSHALQCMVCIEGPRLACPGTGQEGLSSSLFRAKPPLVVDASEPNMEGFPDLCFPLYHSLPTCNRCIFQPARGKGVHTRGG